MTVLLMPNRDFDGAMADVLDQMRRNTHIVVATSHDTGEVRSWQARPRAEAVTYRDSLRGVLGDRWKVRVVRVVPLRRVR